MATHFSLGPLVVVFLAIGTATTCARSALACGASAGGAAGISGCSLEEHEEETRLQWRVGAEYAFTSTGLHFDNGLRVDQIRDATLLTLDYRPLRRVTIEAGAGPFLGGTITTGALRYAMSPGFVGIGGASWRIVDPDGAIPFVLLTGQISYFTASTAGDVGYNAFDARGGAVVGTTIARVFSPYVVGRAFGGPVYWRYQGAAIQGTDDHHWQVGAGLSVLLAGSIDLFFEGIPLGEQGVTAGIGVSM